MAIPILNDPNILKILQSQHNPLYADCFAFYSSWYGGITQNPALMLVPLDDHMVHRGDGVFEAMKAINRKVYLMEEHLERLLISANRISLTPSINKNQMKDIILETLRVANQDNAFIRVFLSRGPGSFSVSPYDTVASQFYVAVITLKLPPPEAYEKGVKVGKSSLPARLPWIATIKSCNYLPSVLMKKEAVDRNLDFVISVDDNNYITEGATENIFLVDNEGIIVYPLLDSILKGTVMMRACELASQQGMLIQTRNISLDDLKNAREIMMAGTTLSLLPVVSFDEVEISNGKPGPITKKLHALIYQDIQSGKKSVSF